MKRTNVVVDEVLLKKVKASTGIHTTRKVIDLALREVLRHRQIRKILELRGTVNWEGDLKSMRKMRIHT